MPSHDSADPGYYADHSWAETEEEKRQREEWAVDWEIYEQEKKTEIQNFGNETIQTFEDCIKIIDKYREEGFRNIRNQTTEICHYAVKKHYSYLKYVTYQTFDICCLAIKQDFEAIAYVREQTFILLFYAYIISYKHIHEHIRRYGDYHTKRDSVYKIFIKSIDKTIFKVLFFPLLLPLTFAHIFSEFIELIIAPLFSGIKSYFKKQFYFGFFEGILSVFGDIFLWIFILGCLGWLFGIIFGIIYSIIQYFF